METLLYREKVTENQGQYRILKSELETNCHLNSLKFPCQFLQLAVLVLIALHLELSCQNIQKLPFSDFSTRICHSCPKFKIVLIKKLIRKFYYFPLFYDQLFYDFRFLDVIYITDVKTLASAGSCQLFNINEGLGLLKLADISLILISPSNVKPGGSICQDISKDLKLVALKQK